MKNKIIGIAIIAVFCAAFLFSGVMFFRQYADAKNSQESFNNLAEMITDVTSKTIVPEETSEEPDEDPLIREAELAYLKYGAMVEKNSDFVGWISIEDTNINYPVMQTPTNPDFYLKHAFDKSYSDYGVPYIEESCALGISNNVVIYGHHVRNGAMFADLCKYTDKSFYEEHPTVQFDTLSTFGEYQIVAVFKFDTNKETFRYNECVTMNEEEFNAFMDEVHARQLYDTRVNAEFGDQLLTLSTCEYTLKNGRLAVVAKKVG